VRGRPGKKHFSRVLPPRCGVRTCPAGGKEGSISPAYPALSRSAALSRAAERHGLGSIIPRHTALDQRQLNRFESLKRIALTVAQLFQRQFHIEPEPDAPAPDVSACKNAEGSISTSEEGTGAQYANRRESRR